MTSLADITGVKERLLREKFGLEPLYQFDRETKENCAFISPSVLVKATELKHGGDLEMSPKKVLSLVTKDILESKDHTLFEVPEITVLRMGYGKNSGNKEGRMAICENEAKTWLSVLDMSFLQLQHDDYKDTTEDMEEEEEEEEKVFDDKCTVHPRYSGLRIPQKGSRILLMSILILTKNKPRNKILASASNKGNKVGKIGPNKISDFLSFWLLPFLLNFTQQKVEEIRVHHCAAWGQVTSGLPEQTREERNLYSLKTVKKSAWDIISQCQCEIPPQLKRELRKYYGLKLDVKYTLLKCDDGSPIVLAPLSCLYHGNNVPVCLEDIGTKWMDDERKLMSREGFLHAFVTSKEIQMDYFKCMKTVKLRMGVDYAIVFPDLDALNSFFITVRREDPNVLMDLKELKCQGRDTRSPHMYHAVAKCSDQNIIVCFTYFQGRDKESMAALFRAIGAHYFNHFTVVLLNGSTFNRHDPDCKLGHIYHVREAECMDFRRGELHQKRETGSGGKKKILSFRKGISNFYRSKFPESFQWWVQSVRNDEDVKAVGGKFVIEPEEFDPNQHLKVAFARNSKINSLKNACLHKEKKIRESNLRKFSHQDIKAANLDGCLLSMIQQHGHKNNISVSLAISNTLGPKKPPRMLKKAVNKVIYYFLMAAINAGLREVFPSNTGEEDQSSHGGPAATAGSSGLDGDNEASDTEDEIVSNPSPSKRHKGHRDKADYRSDSGESDSSVEFVQRKRQLTVRVHQDKSLHRPDKGNSDSSPEPDKKRRPPAVRHKGEKVNEWQNGDVGYSDKKESRTVAKRKAVVFKEGTPQNDELEELANSIGDSWKKLARRLNLEPIISDIDNQHKQLPEKAYQMLKKWKQREADDATYQILFKALSHHLVDRRDLAQKYCLMGWRD